METQQQQTDIITLSRFVLSEFIRLRTMDDKVTGEMTILLNSLQTICKVVENMVRKARVNNLVGVAGQQNVQGEDQKKLDVLSNDVMVNSLVSSGQCAVLVSEEVPNEIIVRQQGGHPGKYCVVFDPLDGSSNIDAGVNIGTIFGIYRVKDENAEGSLEDVLRPGREMVAAGYCMYGSSANIVLTTGNGVNGFTLDSNIGEFLLTHPNIQLPERGNIYSVNEGNSMYFHEPMKKYLDSLKYPGEGKKPYSARYIGSMVADVHRTLLYGGIFAYPSDKKSKDGKLRLLYEAFPMAFLIEQAGGVATTGTQRVLDVQPHSIHQRVPVFLGSKEDVQDLLTFMKN